MEGCLDVLLTHDRQLLYLAYAARQLGSSVGIRSSAYRLHRRLTLILYLFRENAADLFPSKVSRKMLKSPASPNFRHIQRNKRIKLSSPPLKDTVLATDQGLPHVLSAFSEDIQTLYECINRISEFADDTLNTSFFSLKDDLKVYLMNECFFS